MVGNNWGIEQGSTKVCLKRGICIGGSETMGAAIMGRPHHTSAPDDRGEPRAGLHNCELLPGEILSGLGR